MLTIKERSPYKGQEQDVLYIKVQLSGKMFGTSEEKKAVF